MVLLKLFWSFLQIGLLSFGGGMAALPLIQNQVVDLHGWITLKEYTDLITIAEMTPGPIGINAAAFVGVRIAGVPGSIIATVGCVLPPFLIVLLLVRLYLKYKNLSAVQGALSGIRPAVTGLIASAALTILILILWGENGFSTNLESLNFVAFILFAASLIVLRKWKPNPIFIILGSGIVGGAIYLLLLDSSAMIS